MVEPEILLNPCFFNKLLIIAIRTQKTELNTPPSILKDYLSLHLLSISRKSYGTRNAQR